jgi:hypothetical protein
MFEASSRLEKCRSPFWHSVNPVRYSQLAFDQARYSEPSCHQRISVARWSMTVAEMNMWVVFAA